MTQTYKQALTQHLAEMTARQIAVNNQVKELQAKALVIQEERDHLLMTIQGLDDGGEEVLEMERVDKRCGSCVNIRAADDVDRCKVRTHCVKRHPSVGGTFWVEPDDEGCDKWEVMR